MKILVIDREDITARLMKSRLEPVGHQIVEQAAKNDAIEHLGKEKYDLIFLDPLPLTSPRPVIVSIRRACRYYPYIIHMAETGSQIESLRSGANDFLAKPVDPQRLDVCIENAKNIATLIRRIGDDSEDFPSAGGIIAKSAFNQLFLSAVDRADRYAESTCALFIRITNFGLIEEKEGTSTALYKAANLAQALVDLRRQSDIIAQTEKFEYALLLQRPNYESEPMEAASRFAEVLGNNKKFFAEGRIAPELTVTLVSIPTGAKLAEYHLGKEKI